MEVVESSQCAPFMHGSFRTHPVRLTITSLVSGVTLASTRQQQRFPTTSSPRTLVHRSTAKHYACRLRQQQLEHKYRRMNPCLLPSIDRHRISTATPTAARTCPATGLAACRCLAIVALSQTSRSYLHQMQDRQTVREWSAAEQQQDRK